MPLAVLKALEFGQETVCIVSSGNASIAAAAKMARDGAIKLGESVICIITGHGLKSVPEMMPTLTLPTPLRIDVQSLIDELHEPEKSNTRPRMPAVPAVWVTAKSSPRYQPDCDSASGQGPSRFLGVRQGLAAG